jgi:hypothetical protein
MQRNKAQDIVHSVMSSLATLAQEFRMCQIMFKSMSFRLVSSVYMTVNDLVVIDAE